MKHSKSRKKIAPIIITVLLVLYLLGNMGLYFIGTGLLWMLKSEFSPFAAVLGLVIPIAAAGVAIAMLLERMEEIDKGEEDDLSKY